MYNKYGKADGHRGLRGYFGIQTPVKLCLFSCHLPILIVPRLVNTDLLGLCRTRHPYHRVIVAVTGVVRSNNNTFIESKINLVYRELPLLLYLEK